MKVFAQVASAGNIEDPAVLDPLIATGSWQTLMTFTRETNRAHSYVLGFEDNFLTQRL